MELGAGRVGEFGRRTVPSGSNGTARRAKYGRQEPRDAVSTCTGRPVDGSASVLHLRLDLKVERVDFHFEVQVRQLIAREIPINLLKLDDVGPVLEDPRSAVGLAVEGVA